MSQRLVLLSGYPGSGKTTIADFLVHNSDFCRIAKPDLREMAYRPRPGAYTQNHELWVRKEAALNQAINTIKVIYLLGG